jgi:predicted Zn-dependent protease
VDIRILSTHPLFVFVLLLTCFGLIAIPQRADARTASLIRDAEIENTIRIYATPVFKAAGLDPRSVNIYIVKDNSLNAFVAGGQNLFIHTGLLTRSNNASQIIGVIAHEVGHIAGGHLSRIHDALTTSSIPSILSYILGGAAAIATGRGDLGAAVVSLGSSIGTRNFLSYSRREEASADHAALKFLDDTKQSASGFLEFMKVLEDQELLSSNTQDPYLLSHPVSSDRVRTVENHVKLSPYSNTPTPVEYVIMHARMKAKLIAFIASPGRTLKMYKKSNKSLESRYARIIAYYRKADLKTAIPLLDQLIAENPSDPYFIELRGQIFFENGKINAALPDYQKASTLLPDSAVIRKELAYAQIESGRSELLKPAISNLRMALAKEPKSSDSWHKLAIAYGRIGEKGQSSLALAEEALLNGKPGIAKYHGGLAEQLFSEGSREWLQAQDIQIAAKDLATRIKKKKE